MTYGDIIPVEVSIKLMMVSFREPATNLRVFKFVESIRPMQEYITNERKKLIERYGSVDENGNISIKDKSNLDKFYLDFQIVLSQNVDEDIPDHGLTFEDFSDVNCRYPDDRNYWMSASDIISILKISQKINEARSVQCG